MNQQSGEDSTTPNPTVSQPGLRRSTRSKLKPDRYSPSLTLLLTEQQDPSSVAEAKSSPDTVKWTKAMEMEMELSGRWRVVGSKWVFKWKIDADITRPNWLLKAALRSLDLIMKRPLAQLFDLNHQVCCSIGGSTQITASSDGCIHRIPPWRTHRRGVYEATRRIH